MVVGQDIPDVAGDRIANVRTLSVRLGVPRVFNICRALMLVAYGGAVVFGLCATTNVTSCLVTVRAYPPPPPPSHIRLGMERSGL